MEYILKYFEELLILMNEMSPYLLLGFLIAGILHVYFPKDKVSKYLGKKKFSSVFNAALIGIPLPLCSCGVIPTGISFYKNGASKGSTTSFLISTPQTGVDSILVTYSLIGLPFAVIRPIVAFVTGIVGGSLVNKFDKNEENISVNIENKEVVQENKNSPTLKKIFKYSFVSFFDDIADWLLIGLFLAALISIMIPDNFFTNFQYSNYLSMPIVLLAAIPLYVCATGSVPIAMVLLMKGISPGAVLVFLMAGPATNIATITIIKNSLGKKTLLYYLFTIIGGSLFFGFIINQFLPKEWFFGNISNELVQHHDSHFQTDWVKYASTIILSFLLIYSFFKRNILARFFNNGKTSIYKKTDFNNMEIITLKVQGMTCNHCKANVEKNITTLVGIEKVYADIKNNSVKINGNGIDLQKVKKTIESLGYTCKEK
ncbi:MAG: heavy metal-associated domain-containing protein [Bacteroidetes bacterium]|nr:heavy metal-associated domain-containing protein [Bacteroidota bacterium]MBT6687619.1 heavy metal-associated domain-containing protein [Bacteroidota bacterium]MBT7144748.1 heavy metal-associated domain-containing protein [Bacteroidota bacterium]MBT7491764.1 heavy metal-associated domain-containing protein [Bacteroidota bacterium]